MKRRDFIFKSFLSVMLLSVSLTEALADVIWVKPGTLGYKEISPPQRMKKNEKCLTCKWFQDDGKISDGGLCTLKAINKGKTVYVRKEGICSMWAKKV